MKRLIAITIAGLVLAGAGAASAQPSRPFQLELTGGFRAGGNGTVGEGRLFAGYSHHWASSERRSLFAAVGFEGTSGEIAFNDPRGVDGEITAPRSTYGPSARVGFAWAKDSSWADAYLFAGATALVAKTRTDSLTLAEAGSVFGTRYTIGAAFPGSYAAIVEKSTEGSCDGGGCGLVILLLLAPNTIEISFEQLYAGGEVVNRWGLGFGWSL